MGDAGVGGHADQRPEPGTTRDDERDPYGRKRDGLAGSTKSTFLGNQSGGANAYRWAIGLGGEPDLSKPYAQHPWVYDCVAALGRAASSVPARLDRRGRGGELEQDTTSELSQSMGMPNPLQSQRKFFRAICTSQQLYGETFIILLKRDPQGRMVPVESAGGSGMTARIEQPEEFWPVRGDLVEAVLDPQTKLPAAWRFTTGRGYIEYPAHAIVQIAEVNPYNPLRGMGPMQAAYRTAAKDFIIDRYDEALLQNGGSPGGVLSVDGPLTDADQRAIREAWQEAHGRPESHRKTAVLPQGTTYKEIGMSPQAMEHEKLRDWDRQTILSIFGVPPVVLGLETINYATAREQNRIFWETSVLPYLDFLKDELQHKLINRINSPDSELLLDFDITGVSALREDMDAKVDRTLKVYNQGHRSFSEAAHLSGWDISDEDLTGTDERYVPANLAPVGELLADDLDDEERHLGTHLEKDTDDLDEVYAKWRATVNMSASELEAWSENECSRKASLDPAAVIKRNLRLLRKKKGDWNARDIRDANRTISFVARMRNMPKGDPVVEGCPSKRDISLRNWAFNPDKNSKSITEDIEAVEPRAWPDHLDTEEKRLAYWKLYTEQEDKVIAKVHKRTKRVYRDLLLSTRKRLKAIAEGKKEAAATMQTKAFTDAELERLLGINLLEWSEMLADEIQPSLMASQVAAAEGLAAEVGVSATITSIEDPFITAFYKDYPVYLAEGPTSDLALSVRKAILVNIADTDIGSVNSLREAIRLTLSKNLRSVDHLIDLLDNRADRIARTETIKANNGARVAEMKNNDIEQHTWLSSRDNAVRDSHRKLDGDTVEVGKPFANGLSWPGDRAASAREVVNCRCTTIPVVKQEPRR